MTIDLTGKQALVGAATDGLGKAIATELASCGASVTIVARNQHKLAATLETLDTSRGQRHQYLVVDYATFDANKLIYQAYFAHHSVDILVNNTNGPSADDILSLTDADYLSSFNLLFQNTTYLSQLALPHMIEQKSGRIINVAGSSVKEPMGNLVTSSVMRTAVVSWMKLLAKKVAVHGITVNTILTGMFNTDRLQALLERTASQQGIDQEKALQQLVATIPMQRVGEPSEYASLVTFLASDKAGYLTGTTIPLDGGMSNYV